MRRFSTPLPREQTPRPVTLDVVCMGNRHRLHWDTRRLTCLDHTLPDLDFLRAFQSPCRCLTILDGLTHVARARLLPPRPREVPHRLWCAYNAAVRLEVARNDVTHHALLGRLQALCLPAQVYTPFDPLHGPGPKRLVVHAAGRPRTVAKRETDGWLFRPINLGLIASALQLATPSGPPGADSYVCHVCHCCLPTREETLGHLASAEHARHLRTTLERVLRETGEPLAAPLRLEAASSRPCTVA